MADSSTMRAVRVPELGEPSVCELVERPVPEPGAGELLVEVAAAGVNFADLAKRRGTYPDGPEPPYVPGIEVSGTVTATGPDADRTTGQPVVALPLSGGYAEFVVVDEDYVFDVPTGLDLEAAAGVPVQWLTAHNCLFERGDLGAGECVLVHAAAGGVGSAAVQLAAAADATVFGTASTAEKRAFASDLGAQYTIDYTERDVTAAIEAMTDGAGVDLVLDGVGGEAFEQSLAALAPGGRIVAYGLASGDVPRVSTPRLLFGNHAVLGYHLRPTLDHDRDAIETAIRDLDGRLGVGLSVEIDRRLPLDEAAAAHRHLAARETKGKVLLVP